MPIKITPELEEKVHIIFSSGNYRTEHQVLDEALKLLEQRDQLRRKLQVGVEQLDRGERINGDEVFSELRNGIDQVERQEP